VYSKWFPSSECYEHHCLLTLQVLYDSDYDDDDVMMMIYVGGATVEQYCPRSDGWSAVASLPRRRLQFAVAAVGQRVYVVGGRDGLRTLDVVQVFDVCSLTWSTITAMNTHRHGLGQNRRRLKSIVVRTVFATETDPELVSK